MCLIHMCFGMLSRYQDRCRTIATYVLFFANVAFLLAGLTTIGWGLIFMFIQDTVLLQLPFDLSANLYAAPIVATGVLVYVVSVLGFASAWKQWRSLLITYALCLVVLIVIKGCVAVMTWGKVHIVDMAAFQYVTDLFKDPDHHYTFELLELTMQCCGTYGALSYIDKGRVIPRTCCGFDEDVFLCGASEAFEGCADIISTRLQVMADVADVTLFYAIGVEALALVCSLYLLRTSEKPQLLDVSYTVVPTNNVDSHEHVEMDQMQLVTSQPGQIVYEPCELPV